MGNVGQAVTVEHISDRVSIAHGDCHAMLAEWPDDAALVTDPPYGIGYAHSGGGRGVGAGRNAHRPIHGDDAPFDPSPFVRFRWSLLWGAQHYRARLPETGTLLVWDKGAGGIGPDDTFYDADLAWTNVPGIKRNVFRFLWKGVACVKAGEENGRRYHPSQKPVALCMWCLRTLALPPGTLVLDPFMGSGSMGVACHRAGMRYLGVEIDSGHYEIARERLSRECMQAVLPL